MAKISINMKSGEIEKEEIIVGIDLGTTNSLAAYFKDGQNIIIKDENGSSSLVPSVIYFDEGGNSIVGENAKKNLNLDPTRTIYSVKRLLGKNYEDLKNYIDLLSYEIIDQEDQLVKVKVGDKFYNPIELSAEILKFLKRRIEKQTSQEVTKAVITVPAYFNDAQRQATRDAGKIAGLEVLRIVNEPTAAALAYGIGLDKEKSEIIVVYDLGGGTFDVSVLRIEGGVFDVLSTNGDTFLGGDDFDLAIIKHWCNEKGIDLSQLEVDKSLAQLLRSRAEEAKKYLSYNDHYTSADESFKLSKNDFESLIQEFINKTIDKSQAAIKDAEISLDEISKIVLVGGSTRIPLIKERLIETFGKEIHDDLDPDEVVALGASIQADILAGNNKDFLLLDITPLSLGIETMGGLMDTIIPRNSKVPISAGRSYTTSVDGQKNLKVAVYQGERELVEFNRKLGEFILRNIPPMPAGIPKIEVHFILDADGILRVKALESRSSTETEIEIKSQYGISEQEMGKMLMDSIQNAEQDMKFKALQEAKNEANSIILASEKFKEQNKVILSEEEMTQLDTFLNTLKESIQKENKDAINKAMHELNEFSRPLAERAMDYNISQALKGKTI